jgi:hypothetical protein
MVAACLPQAGFKSRPPLQNFSRQALANALAGLQPDY